MEIKLQPRKVAQFLLMLTAGFALVHIAGQLIHLRMGSTFGFLLFDPDQEQSIPRFYSSVLLLLCSGLLSMIAVAKKSDIPGSFLYWSSLALIFLFLAVAKNSAIHETLAVPIRSILKLSKLQFYVWVYGIVVVIFFGLYRKFLVRLPRRTRLFFALGGVVFLVGAFGFDLLVAYAGRLVDHHSLVYLGLVTLEEALEMSGIVILVYGLLEFMGSELKWVQVRVNE